MGPFSIKKKIHNLAYEIKIPYSLGIHQVISVIHLEQAPKDTSNRQVQVSDCELNENKYPFEVDIILAKHFKEISKYLPSFANVLLL